MSRRETLSRTLVGTACLLILAVLAFLFFVGPRTGWSKFARTETGKTYHMISDEAPTVVQVAFYGAVLAIPVCIIGYCMARPRATDRSGGD